MNDQLVWIDCEMTGLDLARDALIEIACIVTDGQLNAADEGIDLVIKPPAEALDHMPEVVREMHTASGLLTELASGITLAEAQEQVLAYVRSHVREPRKVPLCGNSIATDRTFIARDMPELDSFLHYRMVDVSSIKELARRWYPRVYFASPDKHGGHRALADIRESIRELQYYREAIFVPLPGPDSATAREIAARHSVPYALDLVKAPAELAGAAEAVLAPAFAAMGRKTTWLGAAGQGSRMKLVVNSYLCFLVEGVAEALELAARLGIDPAGLDAAIEGGPLDAPLADAKLHKMARGDFAPEFPLEWALKDIDLAIAAADGARLPLLEALSRQWRSAVEAGHGREDISAARLALES